MTAINILCGSRIRIVLMNIKYSESFNVSRYQGRVSNPFRRGVPRPSHQQTAWYHRLSRLAKGRGRRECEKREVDRIRSPCNKQRPKREECSAITIDTIERLAIETRVGHGAIVINRRASVRDDFDEAYVIRLLVGREDLDETLVNVICLS